MKIGDELLPVYAVWRPFVRRTRRIASARSSPPALAKPMDEKKRLAGEIVARYHGPDAAQRAREYFEATVQRKEVPDDQVPEMEQGEAKRVSELLVKAGFAQSRRAAERLILGNAVRIDGEPVSDANAPWPPRASAVLSVGSRRFVRVLGTPER